MEEHPYFHTVIVSSGYTYLEGLSSSICAGNYSTFEDAHERDQQHRAELAQRQHDKQDKMEKQIKEME